MRVLTRILFAATCTFAIPAYADTGADAKYKQGIAYKAQGKNDEAIKALEGAVSANANHGMAWASLGHLYKQKPDLPKAINAYEKASAILKKDKVVWGNLGMAYYRNKQIDKAIEALTVACRLDPKDHEIRANLGSVRRQKGDIKGAIIDLEMATKLKPDEASYWNNLSVAYSHAARGKGDADKPDPNKGRALKASEKAAQLSPNDPVMQFNLGVRYRQHEMTEQAIVAYEKAVGLDPGYADAWYDLGLMYKDDKQFEKSIGAFNKYLETEKGQQDPEAQQRAKDEIQKLGGKPTGAAKKPAKAPKKKK